MIERQWPGPGQQQYGLDGTVGTYGARDRIVAIVGLGWIT